jgi:hypothetical protein
MALTLWPESRAFRGEPRPQQSELKNTQEPRGNAEMTWGKRRGEAGICRAELQREEYPHLLMLSRMVAAPQAPYEQPRLLPTRPNPAMLKKIRSKNGQESRHCAQARFHFSPCWLAV